MHRLVPDQGVFFGTSRGFAALQRSGGATALSLKQSLRCAWSLHFHAGVSLTQQAELSWQTQHACHQVRLDETCCGACFSAVTAMCSSSKRAPVAAPGTMAARLCGATRACTTWLRAWCP